MITEAEEIDRLRSIAVAEIDPGGVLLSANAGFRRLAGAGVEIGTRVASLFLQPSFVTLSNTVHHGVTEIYDGLMTLGEIDGKTRTLCGRVWRTPKGLRVVAEYDIDELERVAAAIEDLNRETLVAERALGVENVLLKRLEAKVREISLTDELTGIGNRRKLDDALSVEIARVTRTARPLSALMADLDHFKRVNDGFGHAVGDKLLANFGRILRTQTRPTDIPFRFGGEEFVVLMPNTGISSAVEVAERIRTLVASERVEPLPEPVTSSFGVAEYIVQEGATSFLKRLDDALYRAKETGRNKVF